MASTTMATMAILNAKCFKSSTPNTKPTISIPKTLISSKTNLPPPSLAATSAALAGAVFSALASSEPALAAQQIAQIAEGGDNRGLALLLPIIPAIGWVLFNILQPALNQINRMRSDKAVIVGLGIGLGGLMWAASPPPSEAAQELAAVADSAGGDNRGTLLLFVLLPAIGWVLFNILQPALNQLNRMRSQ